MDKKHKSKLERSPKAKKKKKIGPKKREMASFCQEKNSPNPPLHAGIQIANKESAMKSTFVVHEVKNEVSFQ